MRDFMMISGADVSQMVEVSAPVFAEIYGGTYAGDPLYGAPPGEPIAMDVTIAAGVVTGATAVYLP